MGKYTDKVMSKIPHEMKSARFEHECNRIFREQIIKEKSKMGYRSTVAYTIRFTPHPSQQESEDGDSPSDEELKQCRASFYVFLAEAKVKHAGAFGEDFGVKVDEGNMALNFLEYDVKWYETYEDVQVHEELMALSQSWAKMENKNIGGIFMRIGEETDDIVEEEWGEANWDWMRIHRSIECDWEEPR